MKAKISIVLIFLGILLSCEHNKLIDNSKIKKGMIKVAIFYPNGEDKTFDMDYYSSKHMPMAARLFGDSLKAMAIDKGLASGTPDMLIHMWQLDTFILKPYLLLKRQWDQTLRCLKQIF